MSGLPAPDFNAPHGVRWSDSYFNPPDPGEWDWDDLVEYAADLVGDLVLDEEGDGRWTVELVSDEYPKGCAFVGGLDGEKFATEYDAIAYFVAEREDWIEEKLDERERERIADGPDEDERGL